MRFLTAETILRLHTDVLARGGGSRGVLNGTSIDAAVARHRHGPFPGEADLAVRAAFLLRGIGQDHPFADGNKRTAFEAADLFLHDNGWYIAADASEVVRFMLAVAGGAPGGALPDLTDDRTMDPDSLGEAISA